MKKWTNRKIAFLAVLISVSIVFIIVGVRLFPPAILPNLRFTVEGLPIKITGLLFGPVLGGITAALADILSYLFVPGIYSVYYLFGIIITGIVPGIVISFYNLIKRKFNNQAIIERNEAKIEKYGETNKLSPSIRSKKINKSIAKIELCKKLGPNKQKLLRDIYMYSAIIIIVLIIISLNTLIYFIADKSNALANFQWIKNKYAFMALVSSGPLSMIIIIIIGRFFFKIETYAIVVPIIIFSAILEPIVVSIVSFGDVANNVLPSYESALVFHIIWSPVKIWINTVVIFVSYKIISPLVFKKQSNSY